MNIYRMKPVEVEAMKWDGTAEGAQPIIEWVKGHGWTAWYRPPNRLDYTSTRELVISKLYKLWVHRDDWIVFDQEGEFSVCDPYIFYKTYEFVSKGD